MSTAPLHHPIPTAHGLDHPDAAIVLITDPSLRSPLRSRRLRPWHRALARCRGFSLDARLATGTPPDAGWLLATRARILVTPASRDRLARDWEHLVESARARPAAGPRVPLRRDRIAAADADIRELQGALRVTMPVPARGVAMARHLLEDATGPVYNPRSALGLPVAVQDAIRHLDPTAWP